MLVVEEELDVEKIVESTWVEQFSRQPVADGVVVVVRAAEETAADASSLYVEA